MPQLNLAYRTNEVLFSSRKSSEMSLEAVELSLSSDMASALLFSGGVGAMGVGLEEVVMEMDKLSVEETRDLLISLLFVLKHLDTRELLCCELGYH